MEEVNNKKNILDAWIIVEQLSEGSIKKDQNIITFDKQSQDFKSELLACLEKNKDKNKINDKNFKNCGLAIYFDIFNFKEIIDILNDLLGTKNCKKVYYDINKANKFSFVIFLDNKLNFLDEKFFYTISGYIRSYKEIPLQFKKIEEKLCKEIHDIFEKNDNFNEVFSLILSKYKINKINCCYKFINNLEIDEVNLHSFFINDLERAKEIENENLDIYFNINNEDNNNVRIDLNLKDKEKISYDFFENILQPKNYPLGRFPSNPEFSLSLMQQVATNIYINKPNTMLSVNGPPGTGKTTLLRDIFSHLIVEQAKEICNLHNKKIDETLSFDEDKFFAILPMQILNKNIVVASSNNGAVQNIVNELPLKSSISNEFIDEILDIDYFSSILNKDNTEKNKKEKYWGTFSLEGGSQKNLNRFFSIIDSIKNELNFNSDKKIYDEFIDKYKILLKEKNVAQKYFDNLKMIKEIDNEIINLRNEITLETEKKEILLREKKSELEKINQTLINLKKEENELQSKINVLNYDIEIENRNLKIKEINKPPLFFLQKIFNKSNVLNYICSVENVLDKINSFKKESRDLLIIQNENRKSIEENINLKLKLNEDISNEKISFEQWKRGQRIKVECLYSKKEILEEENRQKKFNELDLNIDYDELQKSNPWFDKDFRTLQSELFILALKVRKQFLCENKETLSKAKNIFKNRNNYINRKNGKKVLEEAWQWINFTIPVVSTTFASFSNMFRGFGENFIGNLFIDEAGQALPQASVGAIFRSKRVLAVGDPAQIKPVLTLDENVLSLISEKKEISSKFLSINASTQTIIDDICKYGVLKSESEWIGIPLCVHRRCKNPMYNISNNISYNGMMVQGLDNFQGISNWYDVTGNAKDKYVKEQSDFLQEIIKQIIDKDHSLANEIYVISPFRHVAYQLSKDLEKINFTKRENGKIINVGTVHTFQGKEAKIVFLVLGADKKSEGAARWAVSEPNIMNVAATRAKEEFYIIGDKRLYSGLGSNVVRETINVIDHYNANKS
ncbi:AAA domain-containing protein [Anaerofustis sp. HA2171]|uniref:AAA domain-containing protein n=1 Tax=Anaerofustis butyriciformans TaxID=3108533 RepID=UPI002E311679|nr:AAA domain-containing protein [Anaerofustis sp. HA2171]